MSAIAVVQTNSVLQLCEKSLISQNNNKCDTLSYITERFVVFPVRTMMWHQKSKKIEKPFVQFLPTYLSVSPTHPSQQ